MARQGVFFLINLFIYAYIVPFLLPVPHPLPLPTTPLASRQNLFCPFLQFKQGVLKEPPAGRAALSQ
jgi:hypothetical protein